MLDDIEPWQGQTYYGRRSLKQAPFNNWVVGGYIFLAGMGGKISLLTAIADRVRPDGAEAMIRRGRYLPLVVPTLGAGLLIYDLHTPQRFYNMFRMAKATSPMSIGTWILSGYSLAGVATAAMQYLSERLGRPGLARAASAANVPAGVLGAGMGTYTAALLAATSTPLWAAAPRVLASRFAAAAFASASAALSLLETEGPTRRALDTVTALALATELVLDRAMDAAYREKGVEAARDGGWGLIEKVGATGIGAALPLGLLTLSALGGGRGHLSRVASALALGGALLLRVSIMAAGDHSAETPAIAFRLAQPDNLPRIKPPRRAAGRARQRRLQRQARREQTRPSG